MITYNTDGVKMPKLKKREITKWIKTVAEIHGRIVGEIGYLFVNDEKILECNRDYLRHDYYTDIITFDYDEGNQINGDIVISLDTVHTNAEKFGKTYEEELYALLSMEFSISVALMIRGREREKSWRTTKTRLFSF